MSTTTISLSTNLPALVGQLQLALQKAMNLVAVGLQAGKGIGQFPLVLPDTAYFHQVSTNEQWTPDPTDEEWQRLVLVNGFRDVSEAIGHFLDEAQLILAVWSLAALEKQRERLTGADWNEIVGARAKRFHRLGLPDKI